MAKTLLIHCPRCQGTLEVDVEGGRVVRHWAKKPEKAAEDFASLAEQVKRRAEEGLPDVSKVLEEQQRRRDADFERAKRKLQEEPPPESPPAVDAH